MKACWRMWGEKSIKVDPIVQIGNLEGEARASNTEFPSWSLGTSEQREPVFPANA